jgi:hypothetical protein
METTTDNKYDTISGTDEVLYDLPSGLPSFDVNKPAVGSCPYYAVKYTEGIFSIFNSSGNRIGALKKKEIPVDSWNLYDLTGLIKVIQQQKLDGTDLLNSINYYGVKDVGAINFFFDGEKIVCTGSLSTISAAEVRKNVEYYVSNTDCYNTWNGADEYCILKKNADGSIDEMNFYFTVFPFEDKNTYSLDLNTRNLFSFDIKGICSITVGSYISGKCIDSLKKYTPYPDIVGSVLDSSGKFIFPNRK